MRSKNPREFLSAEESALVEQAIARAESATSAQIKFVIARHCWEDIRDKARRVFKKLGLYKTASRNCVLILLVTTNREFHVYGDSSIHEKAGQAHWDEVCSHMAARFKDDAFAQGLSEGIAMIGEKLALHFPHGTGDTNEIPNAVDYQE